MVQFRAAIVGLVSLLIPLSSVSAFTSNSINPAAKKVELARAKVQEEYAKMANFNMVAGGAQAEEYYEGTYTLLLYVGYTFSVL